MGQILQNCCQQKNIKKPLDRYLKNLKIQKLALLIYWVVLTFLLFKPAHLKDKAWYVFDGVDKVIHLSVFALLGFIFMVVFSRTKFLVFIQIMLLYAFFTEIVQNLMNMGRSMETLDIVADFLGVCFGYSIFRHTKRSNS